MKHLPLLFLFLSLAFSCCACSSGSGDDSPEIPGGGNTGGSGAQIEIAVGSSVFAATLANNAAAEAFLKMLPITIEMGDVNSNEKFYSLPQSLPTATYSPGTIRAGDLMLYGSSGLVLFYKTFSSGYSYTRLGAVDNPSGLENALGNGSVTVTILEPVVTEPERYTLTYNTNGATAGSTPSAVTRDAGSTVTLDAGTGFSRDGYNFAGWNTDLAGSGTRYAGGSIYTLDNDITLYAMWQQNNSGNRKLFLTANGETREATLADNSSAAALAELLKEQSITIQMSDYGNMEKVGPLGSTLPRNDEQITTSAGDLILYQGNSFVIYYSPNTYSLTRLGKIENVNRQQLLEWLGNGNVTVTLSLE